MKKCFVIQPFNEKYDDYYTATFKPAIESAGLEAYRVDEDHTTRVIIDSIEKEISDSAICFAEISEDNPNVWYELGFAFASKKDVVMVCSDERKNEFPFDIRQRSILPYKAGSPSSHRQLQGQITQKLLGYLKTQKTVDIIQSTPLPSNSLLNKRELIFLNVLLSNMQDPDEGVSLYSLKKATDRVSCSAHDYMLALKKLQQLEFIQINTEYDSFNNQEYKTCNLTEKGDAWIIDNSESLIFKEQQTKEQDEFSEDEIPF